MKAQTRKAKLEELGVLSPYSRPRVGNANPMTYLGSDGKQYLAIAATDELVVFSLQGSESEIFPENRELIQ